MHRHQAHPVASLLEDRRFRSLRGGGARLQRVHEPAERHAAFHLVLPRQLRDVQHVGERLLAARTQHEPDVRPRVIEQRGDRVGGRPAIALPVKLAERLQGVSNRRQPLGKLAWRAKRVKGFRRVVVLEQLFVADREQRPAQRREYRQLIVRPLDGGQRRAQRLDLLTIVERLAADEEMGDSTRFERFHVRPGDVFAVADKPAKQQADVPRLERDSFVGVTALGDRPSTAVDEPLDVRANRLRQRLLNLHRGHRVPSIWLRHRQRYDRRLRRIVA